MYLFISFDIPKNKKILLIFLLMNRSLLLTLNKLKLIFIINKEDKRTSITDKKFDIKGLILSTFGIFIPKNVT